MRVHEFRQDGPEEPGHLDFADEPEFVCDLIGRRNNRDGYGEEDIPSDTCMVPQVDYIYSSVYRRLGWISSPESIKFSEDDRRSVWLNRIRSFDDIQRYCASELVNELEPWRSNLHCFLVDLTIYHEYAKGKHFEAIDLFRLSLERGPIFAKQLDQYNSAAIGRVNKCGYLSHELAEVFVGLPYNSHINRENFDLTGLFTPNRLFNWDAPTLDLRDVSFVPVNISYETMERFRAGVRRVLSDPRMELFQANDWKELENDTSSKCLEGPVYTVDRKTPDDVRGKSVLVDIPREKKEKRLAIINSYATNLRVRWIDSNVARLLAVDKRSMLKNSMATIRFAMKKAMNLKESRWKGHGYDRKESMPFAYCRDFKKEGLTKPRVLLRIMMECLHEKFPTAECFRATTFFDSWEPEDKEGNVYKTTRGHGLGMANALTTLMQCAIEEMNTARCEVKPKRSFYYNDDAAVVLRSDTDLSAYMEADRLTCKELSLIFKEKATFVSQGYIVLCQQHVSDIKGCGGTRSLYPYYEFGNLFKCINVAHARASAASMNVTNVPKAMLRQLVTYWGWLLYRGEADRPSEFGGWWGRRIGCVNAAYALGNRDSKLSDEVTAAREALKIVKLQPKPWLKVKGKKGKLKNYRPKDYADYSSEYTDLIGGERVLNQQTCFRPSADGRENDRMWTSYLVQVRKVYRELYRKKAPLTVGEAYEQDRKANPEIDYWPPEGLVTYKNLRGANLFSDFDFNHPYRGHGKSKDYSDWLHYNKKNEYNILTKNPGLIKFSFPDLGGVARSSIDAANQLKKNVHWVGGQKPRFWQTVLVPEDEDLKEWHNPFEVGSVIDTYYPGAYRYPIPSTRSELLEKRKYVYGRELTAIEWMEVGTISPIDQRVLTKFLTGDETTDEIKEFCSELRRSPGFGHYLDESRVFGHGIDGVTLARYREWIRRSEDVRARKHDAEDDLNDPLVEFGVDVDIVSKHVAQDKNDFLLIMAEKSEYIYDPSEEFEMREVDLGNFLDRLSAGLPGFDSPIPSWTVGSDPPTRELPRITGEEEPLVLPGSDDIRYDQSNFEDIEIFEEEGDLLQGIGFDAGDIQDSTDFSTWGLTVLR